MLKGCGLAFVLEIILDLTRLDSLVGLYFAILSYLTALPEAILIAANQLIETMDLLPLFSVSGMDWSRFWLAWYLGLRLEVCGFGLVLQNGHVSLYHCEWLSLYEFALLSGVKWRLKIFTVWLIDWLIDWQRQLVTTKPHHNENNVCSDKTVPFPFDEVRLDRGWDWRSDDYNYVHLFWRNINGVNNTSV